jgi:hypothetical protein
MPKRVVKHLSWEVMSEQSEDTPAMLRGAKRYLIKRSLGALTQFESNGYSTKDLWELANVTFAAYHLERYAQAEELAARAIQPAFEQIEDRNAGDAMHAGHTVLGLIALKNQNRDSAIYHLYASAKVPRTPVLMSFGPRMWLAKALLGVGEIQAVVTYLSRCRAFWTHGELWLSVWERKIQSGKIPNFSSNLT